MPRHQIKFIPRQGWNPTLFTITINVPELEVPAFERFRVASTSKRGTLVSPGREFRSVPVDGWLEYEIELRAIKEASDLFIQLTAWLAEADGGREFEFAYRDDQTYDDALTSAIHEQVNVVPVSTTTGLAVGDWVRIVAEWRRSIWGWYKIASINPGGPDFTVEDGIGAGVRGVGFVYTIGSTVRHRDFIPKASLISHQLRKRRGGQADTDMWDLVFKFRELA